MLISRQRQDLPKTITCVGFKAVLAKEMADAPALNIDKGNLITYIKLSVLVMAMVKLYKEIGLGEAEIGEFIYRIADA